MDVVIISFSFLFFCFVVFDCVDGLMSVSGCIVVGNEIVANWKEKFLLSFNIRISGEFAFLYFFP